MATYRVEVVMVAHVEADSLAEAQEFASDHLPSREFQAERGHVELEEE